MAILASLMIVGTVIALTRLWSTASEESGCSVDPTTLTRDTN